ncbi:hypothetical protein RRG08_040436 [Elysia crispata]|uniref:Uncharacterized protein n=1 Tax=Elysia crispata TaxID=231223 RepID=A0AAE0ZCK0_9GAST|nr:hypothetical protein RRG08_040436 [Elysia crispata]
MAAAYRYVFVETITASTALTLHPNSTRIYQSVETVLRCTTIALELLTKMYVETIMVFIVCELHPECCIYKDIKINCYSRNAQALVALTATMALAPHRGNLLEN